MTITTDLLTCLNCGHRETLLELAAKGCVKRVSGWRAHPDERTPDETRIDCPECNGRDAMERMTND